MLRRFSRQFSGGAIALSATNSALTKFEDILCDLGKSSSLDYFSEFKRKLHERFAAIRSIVREADRKLVEVFEFVTISAGELGTLKFVRIVFIKLRVFLPITNRVYTLANSFRYNLQAPYFFIPFPT